MAVATKRMYWNTDKSKLVDEGSPDAAFLAAAVGDDIPDVKKVAKAENKMADPPANKSGVTFSKDKTT